MHRCVEHLWSANVRYGQDAERRSVPHSMRTAPWRIRAPTASSAYLTPCQPTNIAIQTAKHRASRPFARVEHRHQLAMRTQDFILALDRYALGSESSQLAHPAVTSDSERPLRRSSPTSLCPTRLPAQLAEHHQGDAGSGQSSHSAPKAVSLQPSAWSTRSSRFRSSPVKLGGEPWSG